jgi:hypothetical protein
LVGLIPVTLPDCGSRLRRHSFGFTGVNPLCLGILKKRAVPLKDRAAAPRTVIGTLARKGGGHGKRKDGTEK